MNLWPVVSCSHPVLTAKSKKNKMPVGEENEREEEEEERLHGAVGNMVGVGRTVTRALLREVRGSTSAAQKRMRAALS